MRRFMTGICLAGLLGAGATAALAATPATNTSFSGSGGNYQNHNGAWSRTGSSNYHLTTSGKSFYGVKKFRIYIKSFSANYTTTCNGTHPVKATWIKVKPNGSFSFSFASHGAHVRIWGNFTSSNKAKVNYLVDYSSAGTSPSGLNTSCATWVHGTAHS